MSASPAPRPRRRDFRAPWNRRPPPGGRPAWVDLIGVLLAAVAICVVVAACGVALIGGVIARSASNAYDPEKRARGAAESYYAAVARQDYEAAAAVLYSQPTGAQLASLWAQHDAAGPRVAGFTATTVTFDQSKGGGLRVATVTGTLRYVDGTTAPLAVRVEQRGGGIGQTWVVLSPP